MSRHHADLMLTLPLHQDCSFYAKDGTQLHGWLLYPYSSTVKEAEAGSTIVFFQENAGTMAMRLPFLRDLIRLSGCSVFAPRHAILES